MLRWFASARAFSSALNSGVTDRLMDSVLPRFRMSHLLHVNGMCIIILDMDTQLKAYRFRFYPNAAQREQLAVEFAHARFVWNTALFARQQARLLHGRVDLGERVNRKTGEVRKVKTVDSGALDAAITQLSREPGYEFLSAGTRACLTQTLIDQDKAFKNFFEGRAKFPRFKGRDDKQTVRYQIDQRQVTRTYAAGSLLKLPKLGALKVRWSRIPDGTPKMATVSKDASGRYFVAFGCEEFIKPMAPTGKAVGVDLGICDVAATSDGWKSGNPRHLKRQLRHLKRQQRRLSRMQKGSKRRANQRVRVAKLHARIAASRADFLHKTTTAIVRRADVIGMEDLNVKGMVKNHHLARAIADVGMGEFRRQVEYKSKWYGREAVIVDRWAPTSKTCSGCGHRRVKMPLKVRIWTCPSCGAVHDRDVNAAKNILRLAVESKQPVGNGLLRVEGTLNLSANVVGSPDEARTDAEKFTEAACLEQAA